MEGSILLALQAIRIDGLTQLLSLVSALGNSAFIWILAAVVFIAMPEKRRTGIPLLISIILVALVGSLLMKNLIARPRPCDVVQGLNAVMGVSHSGYSFPSFHAASSFAAFIVISRTMGKGWGTGSLALAVAICFSRLYLGVHYPSDVLAGALLGVIIACVVMPLWGRVFDTVGGRISSRPPQRKQARRRR